MSGSWFSSLVSVAVPWVSLSDVPDGHLPLSSVVSVADSYGCPVALSGSRRT